MGWSGAVRALYILLERSHPVDGRVYCRREVDDDAIPVCILFQPVEVYITATVRLEHDLVVKEMVVGDDGVLALNSTARNMRQILSNTMVLSRFEP